MTQSPEAPREPVIPATASRGLAPVGGAGDLQTAAVAGSPGPAAPSSTDQSVDGRTRRRSTRAIPSGGRPNLGVRVGGGFDSRGIDGPSLRKPQRRELSYPLAALAYTWAAIERRTRG